MSGGRRDGFASPMSGEGWKALCLRFVMFISRKSIRRPPSYLSLHPFLAMEPRIRSIIIRSIILTHYSFYLVFVAQWVD